MSLIRRVDIQGYRSSDTTFQPLRLDQATNTIQIIDYPHHEVHAGTHFHCTDVQNVDTTTLYYMITTPNTTKWAHMLFGVECTGEMQVVVTEGADRTGTTALDAINSDRNSVTASGLVIHRGYTDGTTNGATTVFSERAGATGVASKTIATGDTGHGQEYILKQNTKYIIAVTTYANVYTSLALDWYEHTSIA